MFKRTLLIAFIAGATGLTTNCGRNEPVNAAAPTAHSAPATASAETATTTHQAYETSGPVIVENQVDVAARREGIVANLSADVGTHVHKGELLGQLDNRQLIADRDGAEARLRSAQFQVQHFAAEIKVKQADLDRDEQLFKADLITAQQVEHSRYAVESERFEEQREVEYLKGAETALQSLQLEVEKTSILAPFDGVVARRYVRVGQNVAVNERLFWVTAMAPLNVRFTVPQELTGKLHLGDEISVVSPANPHAAHVARVKSVSPVVDPASGTLEVQAQIEGAPPDLVPGITVSIRVPQVR